MPSFSSLFPLATTFAVAACTTVGPDYERPLDNLPTTYKTALGVPNAPTVGNPFGLFRDARLDRLLRQVEGQNQDLAAALARIDQSRALLGLARADQSVGVTGTLSGTQNLDSRNSRFQERDGTPYQDYEASLTLSYEVDLWGRIRRTTNAASAELQATEWDYRAARLSLRSEAARNYLTLRSLDREIALLQQTRDLRQQRLDLTEARASAPAGIASGLDVARAERELRSVEAELARLSQRRGELENSLAALAGTAASKFSLPNRASSATLPNIPAGVPSDLLRRRPDVISAERRLAAASEGIGITIASYLPRLTLTGTGGIQAFSANDIFDPKSSFYTAGPSLAIPIFQGGRIKSDRARSEAVYREALATYRQTLINAVRDVENGLVGNRALSRALVAQRKAAKAAARAAELTRARYEGGIDSLFEVTETERLSLEQQRLLVQTQLDRQLAAVNLIQATGGDYRGGK